MERSEPPASRVRVLFVCLGNICRSPLAEGVFLRQVAEAGLQGVFQVESAGTGNWHVGELPDERMIDTARRHGINLTSRARQFVADDFQDFDHILVMDRSNLRNVLTLSDSKESRHRVRLFREYDPEPGDGQVPDPYFGGAGGFETVYRIVERTSRALLSELTRQEGRAPDAP
jgi:low molecular weight protein-tyrosine phosphatase